MQTLTKNILDTAISEVNSINKKIKGLNFLEILKINLIEKISPIIIDTKFPLEEFNNIEKEINEEARNLIISIDYYTKSLINRKKILDNDTLFLCFNESSSLDVYQDEKKFTNLILYKNTGLSLSKNTVINSKLNKNLLMMEIQIKDDEQILTKLKKI